MQAEVDYHVTAVTVYPDRARVTCRGACPVDGDTRWLVFEGLPLTLDTGSLRVAAQMDGGAQVGIRAVDMRRRSYGQTPDKRVRDLELEIEALEDALATKEDEKAVWEAEAGQLEGLRAANDRYARGIARKDFTAADLAEFLSQLREGDRQVREQQRLIEREQRDLQRELKQKRDELNMLRSARPTQRYEARIEVEVGAPGRLEPQLTYVVRGASWQPLYELQLDSRGGAREMQLTALAQISQNTGQNWDDVVLTVSTARPALTQRLPDLEPWFIDERAAQPLRVAEPVPEAAMAMPTAAAPRAMADMVYADIGGSDTAVTFTVAGYTAIPSDGSARKVALYAAGLPVALDHITVPRHTDAVYRRVTLTNRQAAPLLPGEASLFVDGEFIGATQLAYTAVNAELELLMGVEEQITVERELAARDVDKRFLRDTRQLRYAYKIKLRNGLSRTAGVTLRDQLPVSRHESIKVRLDEVQPPTAEHTELNLLTWQIDLAPDTERTVQYSYIVEHPREMRVTGLVD